MSYDDLVNCEQRCLAAEELAYAFAEALVLVGCRAPVAVPRTVNTVEAEPIDYFPLPVYRDCGDCASCRAKSYLGSRVESVLEWERKRAQGRSA